VCVCVRERERERERERFITIYITLFDSATVHVRTSKKSHIKCFHIFFIYYQEKILKKNNPGNGFAMKIRLIHVSSSKRVEFISMNDVGPRTFSPTTFI